jgi:hypothetical protein
LTPGRREAPVAAGHPGSLGPARQRGQDQGREQGRQLCGAGSQTAEPRASRGQQGRLDGWAAGQSWAAGRTAVDSTAETRAGPAWNLPEPLQRGSQSIPTFSIPTPSRTYACGANCRSAACEEPEPRAQTKPLLSSIYSAKPSPFLYLLSHAASALAPLTPRCFLRPLPLTPAPHLGLQRARIQPVGLPRLEEAHQPAAPAHHVGVRGVLDIHIQRVGQHAALPLRGKGAAEEHLTPCCLRFVPAAKARQRAGMRQGPKKWWSTCVAQHRGECGLAPAAQGSSRHETPNGGLEQA